MNLKMLALAAVVSCALGVGAQGSAEVRLVRAAAGFSQPVVVTHAGDGSNRLFVVEQAGRVRLLKGGQVAREPFLDLSALVLSGGERGLLGLAFDPQFERNRRFFVYYTARNGDNVVARYTARGDRAEESSGTILLRMPDRYANHNGGGLVFGPDGFLYVGTGDGGSAGDPLDSGQSLDSLLGKLLRLDVRGDRYEVPRDNPFVARSGARGEVWAWGLRNPWRFSFDRATGDLFIADVGQNKYEEINLQPARSKGGENYGWRLKEADACFNPASNCEKGDLTDPILQYDHTEGVSVTGGFVYRGKNVPSLVGKYVYADFGSGVVWAAARGSNGRWTAARLFDTAYSVSTFGEDESGELYLADYASGALYRFADR